MLIEAGAPGKVLLIGGYSILEKGNVGFVTTIDAYVHAFINTLPENVLIVNAPDLGISAKGRIDAENFSIDISAPKEMNLAIKAIEIALKYLWSEGYKTSGIEITTKNDAAFSYVVEKATNKISKSGMGSSSAVTVAITSAILGAFTEKVDRDKIHKLSQLSHSLATGKIGSGFDVAAATYGSIKYKRYSPELIKNFPNEYSIHDIRKLINTEWDYKIERAELPRIFESLIANFPNSAAITTTMVGNVGDFKKNNPDEYNRIISNMNYHASKAIDALENIAKDIDVEYNFKVFKDEFALNRKFSKELGIKSNTNIEDDESTRLIDESERNGAFVAKLPGAGGRDSIVALTLSNEDTKKLSNFWTKHHLELLNAKMSNNSAYIRKIRKDSRSSLSKKVVLLHD